MEPHQQRAHGERADLGEKYEKLHAFTATKAFHDLGDVERQLLFQQLEAMHLYYDALDRRIKLWSTQHG